MDKPRAAPAHFPYRDHGTLEQVWQAEARRAAEKIEITRAPSAMEVAAARRQPMALAPIASGPVPVLCEGKVMCRCGAHRPGQTRGPVPVWFGDKCIEARCELRGSPHG